MINREFRIAVVGMGYVGIPAAVLLANAGHKVVGIQRNSPRSGWKIAWLNEGRCPIDNEPVLPEMLKKVVLEKRFKVTDDYAEIEESDIVLIDVQTPVDPKHEPEYESLEEVSRHIGKRLRPGKLVIIESTVAPGTTQQLVQPILEAESGLKGGLPDGFGLCFSYERVMVGRLIHNITQYPKIVGGIDPLSTNLALEMYKSIVQAEVLPTDPLTAEVSKTVENAYRDVQIAFANEVALLCESLGTDVYEVRKFVNGLPNDPSVAHANPVRNMHFPGAGVGGHCLPKDTWLLMHGLAKYGGATEVLPASVLKDARYLNDWMPLHMVDLLESGLKEAKKGLKEATVGVLGYAFLENSDDPRNTPTLSLMNELERKGAAFKIHDPFVKNSEYGKIETDLGETLKDCDALVLMTKHDQYRSITPGFLDRLLRTKVIIDGRNLFDPEEFGRAGYIYRGVGKGKANKLKKRGTA